MRRRGANRAGKARALPRSGDAQHDIATLVDSSRGAGAVAVAGASLGPLVAASTDLLGGFRLDEHLQHQRKGFTDIVQVTVGVQYLQQLVPGQSRAFARLASSVGLVAHPHMLRHALASAMAANKEPASIIAAQLRHADGGALAQRVYIHQLPQTAPRLAGVIEGVFGPAARNGRVVSAGRRAEGNRRETRPSNPA
jgi:hypothetical protein